MRRLSGYTVGDRMPATVVSVKRRGRATKAFSFFAVGECCRAVVFNCYSFDLDDFVIISRDYFVPSRTWERDSPGTRG